MKRQLRGLSYKVFDVLVIGGGIQGAAIAWEAARRGLDVALVDRGDFAGATSANSLKIVHGGLRYLQKGDFKRVRESIRERTGLLRIAPHLVRPLPCILPLYKGGGLKSPFFMRSALAAADLFGFDRNDGLELERSLPGGRVVSEKETARLAPGIRREGLAGGAVWYDAQMMNPCRLVLSFVMSAHRLGAACVNHAEVKGLTRAGKRIIGATIRDRLTGQDINLWSRLTINAAGPWIEDVARLAETRGDEAAPGLSAAMNVMINRPLTAAHAIAATKPGGPVYFIVPWRGMTLIGTQHWPHDGSPDRFRASASEISRFLSDINAALPSAKIRPSDVVSVMSGMLPGHTRKGSRDVELLRRHRMLDHEKRDGIGGLISVMAVKFTTARGVAEDAVNLVFKKLNRKAKASPTLHEPLYGGKTGPFKEYVAAEVARQGGRYPAALVQRLIETYGSEYEQVLACASTPESLKPIEKSTDIVPAEIEYVAKHELACGLDDVVYRRTEMSLRGQPSGAAVEAAAEVLARVWRWEPGKRRREIDDVLDASSISAPPAR